MCEAFCQGVLPLTALIFLFREEPASEISRLPKKMSRERRIQRRFNVCFDAIWDGARNNANARVTDLSEGGCYIDSIAEVAEGEILRLKIKMPDGEWLDLAAEVAHSFARLGFGLRFVNLDEEQQLKLDLLLTHLREAEERRMSRISA
jgi:hypothetical protein